MFRAVATDEEFRQVLRDAGLRGQRSEAMCGFVRSTYLVGGHVPAPTPEPAPDVELCPWCKGPEGKCGCHKIFVRNLATGHDFAEYVGDLLLAAGLPAVVTPMEVRENLADRHRFRNEVDLTVGSRRVEVKSSTREWTSLGDLPFSGMFVDTVYGWDRKEMKPCAVVLVSQPTGALAVVPATSRPHWRKRTTVDRVRSITETFWLCPNEHLRPFDEFTEWLRANQ